MSIVSGLIIFFPKNALIFLIIGFIVCSSRILLTNHYLSDVLAGGYLAFIVVGLFLYFWQDKKFFKKFQ
jgi:membrane-associated phospholipid phosphatase